MTTRDQNIWIERVKKEKALQQKFGLVSLVNGKISGQCSNYGVMRHYVRHGRSPLNVKKRPFYMVDSTYTVPSDPNTMRDTGASRNAEYALADEADKELSRINKCKAADFQNEVDKVNKMMRERCTHARPSSNVDSQLRRSSQNFFGNNATPSKQPVKAPVIIKEHVVVAANDYTKNISSFLFTPSLKQRPSTAIKQKFPLQHQDLTPLRQSSNCLATISQGKDTGRSYKDIEKDLLSEKERREKLEREVRALKDQMSSIQMSVKSVYSK